MVALLFLPAAVAMAGCAGTDDPNGGGTSPLDTGTIPPGAEATLTFADTRAYNLHCDPHPFMTHNVTAKAGGASTAHVHILDGNATDEFRFDPQDIMVRPGTVVTYHNHGSQAHTATELAGEEHGGH